MSETITIETCRIGPDSPCFIIAEAGVNHNGSMDIAMRLIDEAVLAGADAVKFQMFKADKLVARSAPKAEYQMQTTDIDESHYDMLCRLELNAECHQKLINYCQQKGILLLSTPFDEESADELDLLGMPAFKVPSGEVINLPFLQYLAAKGKPILMSTGMANLQEVAEAVEVIRNSGNPPLALLQCLTNYPADPAEINLCAMDTMTKAFNIPVGYSDHVQTNEIAFAAVARGAKILEKHFTLDRGLPGPDHKASLEPEELKALIKGVRSVESALGDGVKRPAASEADIAKVARKSLVAKKDLKQGTVLCREMLIAKRPGTGISPAMLPWVVGLRLNRDVAKDSLIIKEDLS